MNKVRLLITLLILIGMSGCGKANSSDAYTAPTYVIVEPTPTAILSTPSSLPKPESIATPTPTPFVAPTPFPEPTVPPAPIASPTPIISASKIIIPEQPAFTISNEDVPVLTPQGLALIVDSEVGGESYYKRHDFPEYPGGDSGVTWGIGYDAHQNKAYIILSDWKTLGEETAQRLAKTQPYVGQTAKKYLPKVKDIAVPWEPSIDVFLKVDVSRTDLICQKAFPGFEDLRPTAQDAIRSLVFNRGPSMSGPNRTEMRHMRDYGVPNKDYQSLAADEIKMIRVWRGTDIYDGMVARRKAESKLFLTP